MSSTVVTKTRAGNSTVPGPGRFVLPAAAALCVVLVFASLMVGEYRITLSGLLSGDSDMWRMFFISRVPRTLALIFAGLAMSFSGVIMQRLTQNRFVEPTTAGTAEWAGLGVLLCFIFVPGASPLVRMVIATAAAFIGTVVFLGIINRIRARKTAIVPLVGLMLGAVVGAATTYIAVEQNMLQAVVAWRSGGFAHIVRGFYEPLWAVLFVAIGAYLLANYFTIAGLGRDVATSLGLNYGRTLAIGVTMVALATGVTSVVVGFIPFLGLVVPNIVSMLRGDDMRKNLPWIGVVATVLIIGCDLIGRIIVRPMEIPTSVIMGVIGAGAFLAIIFSGRFRGSL
ncbi:iron chelate uptake ABC transporter family permease subunit [Gordonia sp. (in: high G+C Gram-positive bacteria)]|uniref:ABC transporter permease n=1 Tax=Gordonia sp. (in: high G+C Gram-positive bacteria) TaxID=84139 RepID=UPI0025BDEF29|nr:iron chelate uptake ABC transporter family permease subunit [Gordonia sp. (in: high G+C Gram-positive bacteria)]